MVQPWDLLKHIAVLHVHIYCLYNNLGILHNVLQKLLHYDMITGLNQSTQIPEVIITVLCASCFRDHSGPLFLLLWYHCIIIGYDLNKYNDIVIVSKQFKLLFVEWVKQYFQFHQEKDPVLSKKMCIIYIKILWLYLYDTIVL